MGHMPKVSVVMPAFNTEKYIVPAIDSILHQTFTDFEFIIINDGSTDGTADILEAFRCRDARIQIHHQENSGVATAMNFGCGVARGKYIARMDADDISLPARLARQVSHLDRHPEIGLCGTWIYNFSDSEEMLVRYPHEPDIALCTLPFQMSFAGGSIMFDRSLWSKTGLRYQTGIGATDDYLFIVESTKHCKLSSVPEALYRYRNHSAQVTQLQKEQQHRFARNIRLQQLQSLGLEPTEDEINLHESISMWQLEGDRDWVKKVGAWLVKLKSINLKNRKYPSSAFARVVGDYWFAVCTRNARLGLWAYKTFVASPVAHDPGPRTDEKLKLLAKCVAYNFT
jgi:glycosyltransferase involved in cell wall biosynthesis